jgi:hypothetical protein
MSTGTKKRLFLLHKWYHLAQLTPMAPYQPTPNIVYQQSDHSSKWDEPRDDETRHVPKQNDNQLQYVCTVSEKSDCQPSR